MKLYKQARKYGARAVSAVVGVAAPVLALAQTDPVTDAITTLGTKVTTYGGALVAFSIIGVGFAIGVKYIKKAPRAS